MLAYSENNALNAKISGFLAKLNSYDFYYQTHSLIDLLHKFINDNDLMLFYRSLPNGYQRESNIKAILQLASAQTYANNLYGFLDYIIYHRLGAFRNCHTDSPLSVVFHRHVTVLP